MDRDELKLKIAVSIRKSGNCGKTLSAGKDRPRKFVFCDDPRLWEKDRASDCLCKVQAEAVLAAIEESGLAIMPKDQILRKMSDEEFTEMVGKIKFRDKEYG